MADLYNEFAYRETVSPSSLYGYWILPSGTVLSLKEGMTHGAIVEAYAQKTPNESSLSETLAYHRQQDPDIKKTTVADLWACGHLGWIRINISQFSDMFNISWQKKIPEAAQESLRMLLDIHETTDEEVWTDYGTVFGWKNLKAKLDNPIYWRNPA